MCLPSQSSPFFSCHCSSDWIHQWLLHTCWCSSLGVSNDMLIRMYLINYIYVCMVLSAFSYRWLIYINPNYFGLSSVAYFVLSDFNRNCTGNQLECYINSGPYVLNQFFFDNINPYLHILVSVKKLKSNCNKINYLQNLYTKLYHCMYTCSYRDLWV